MKRIKEIFKLMLKPYMRILPGNIAFSFMLALIPILSVFVSITSMLNLSTPMISNKLLNIIPSAVIETITLFLNSSGFNNVILIIIGIWTASLGMNALIIASNVIYGCEDKPYLKRRIKAIILTFLIIIIIVINLVFLVFGDTLLNFIFKLFDWNVNIIMWFSFLKWPISIIIIYGIVKVIYISSPDKKIDSNIVTKGTIFTTIMWIFTSAIYSFYVANIANYNLQYGSLANIIILLIWLYLVSYVLMIGTAINVNEYNKVHN